MADKIVELLTKDALAVFKLAKLLAIKENDTEIRIKHLAKALAQKDKQTLSTLLQIPENELTGDLFKSETGAQEYNSTKGTLKYPRIFSVIKNRVPDGKQIDTSDIARIIIIFWNDVQNLIEIKDNSYLNKINNRIEEYANEIGTKYSLPKEEIQKLLAQAQSIKSNGQRKYSKVKLLEEYIKERVFGQDHAIEQLVGIYIESLIKEKNGSSKDKKPASILFIGDSGTGKSYLAKIYSEGLKAIGERRSFRSYDMSRYTHQQDTASLVGSDPHWRGSHPGELTGYVNNHPNAIILLDEVDRCHSSALNSIMQALDTGVLYDVNMRRDVSFKNTTIIMTTNAGRDLYLDDKTFGYFKDIENVPPQIIKENLKKNLPVSMHAFLDRIAKYVLFSNLSYKALRSIVQGYINNIKNMFQNEGKYVHFNDEEKISRLILFYGGIGSSGRGVSDVVESVVTAPVYKWYRENLTEIDNISKIEYAVDDPDQFLDYDSQPASVLCIDNDDTYLNKIEGLVESFIKVQRAHNFGETKNVLEKYSKSIDFILLDLNLETIDDKKEKYNILSSDETISKRFPTAMAILNHVRKRYPHIQVYIHSGYISTEEDPLHYAFIKSGGAAGFVPKIQDNNQSIIIEKIKNISTDIIWTKQYNRYLKKGIRLNYSPFTKLWQNEDKSGKTLQIFFEGIEFERTPNIEDLQWFTVTNPDTKFDDLVGIEEARMRLEEAIDYLRSPESFVEFGVKPPQGYLLYGPSGTGKTSIAKAVANAADARFIAVAGSIFERKFLGEGPQKVRELFTVARKYSPSIIFIDEIDSLGRRSEDQGYGGVRARNSIINTFLECMDGFTANDGVVIIGATNHKELIDPALLRAGRMGRHLKIDVLHDPQDRKKLIKNYLQSAPIKNPNKVAVELSKWTVGLPPVKIIDMVNEAFLIARRKNNKNITIKEFIEAREFVLRGERISGKREKDELNRTALHESGHAFMQVYYNKPLLQVTIVGRGSALGYLEPEMEYSKTKQQIEQEIDVILGGRCAEALDGVLSEGVSSDLEMATERAVNILFRYGMDESMGVASIGDMSIEDVAKHPHLWDEVQKILRKRNEIVISVLKENQSKLYKIRDLLLKRKTLFEKEVRQIVRGENV